MKAKRVVETENSDHKATQFCHEQRQYWLWQARGGSIVIEKGRRQGSTESPNYECNS